VSRIQAASMPPAAQTVEPARVIELHELLFELQPIHQSDAFERLG
jgi:hypothetical protein